MLQTADKSQAIESGVQTYIKILEGYIRRYPDQWLWETKRWKYSWTKRILILSDGKTGIETVPGRGCKISRISKHSTGGRGWNIP